MTYWEFLIQREGDRGWRAIKTGNLQLMEGKYRIVAKSNLLDTRIQTRVTHQTLGSTVPQRRSRSCNQKTNPRGLLVIAPFTQLHSGIWQFVCSGMTATQTPWHQILKLRVLPRTSSPIDTNPRQLAPLDPRAVSAQPLHQHRGDINNRTQIHTSKVSPDRFLNIEKGDNLATPTEPVVPISVVGKQESWAEGLDRLLEQLEGDLLQPQPPQPIVREATPGTIQLNMIVQPPSQLISLNRSTFSGIVPGNQLTINGACNLQRLTANLIQTVKIEKLSICLRHPQTSEIIVSIEQSLPPDLDLFAFSGQLELPTEPKISLLLGEVNLADRHNIQLGSIGFTVTLNLNPLYESELSSLQLFDLSTANTFANPPQLTQELQVEAVTIRQRSSIPDPTRPTTLSKIPRLNSPQYPTVPLAYRRESLFTHPDIVPVNPHSTSYVPSQEVSAKIDPQIQSQPPITEITGDLEIDFTHSTVDRVASAHKYHDGSTRNYQNLEIVIDD